MIGLDQWALSQGKNWVFLVGVAWAFSGCQRTSVHPLPTGSLAGLVPQPTKVEAITSSPDGRGFRCDGTLTLEWPQGWTMPAMERWLHDAGLRWERTGDGNAQWEWIASDQELGEEGYVLTVEGDHVTVEAEDEEAAFRAWTTLRQLIPPSCEQGCPSGFTLPAVRIEDHAYLAHRGLLLDCCRHFMEPEFVKQIIELLAVQKMNVLHWHLTEDQGWRLPIAAYPKLTEVGAYRTEVDGQVTGGFYSRQEIEDILAFAAERHVTVIPEIEMPGHCRAALAAYPWLGCTGDSLPVPNNWGVFKDVYCAGNDSTMAFMKAVLDELCDLFPSEVIHIGGDEVPKVRWAECPKCQAKMKRLGLHDEAELQTAFINEMGAHLASRGKRIMGWDEILEGGLPEGAMVQSWRGMEGAIEATHLGTDAVVSPTSHCYLDYPLRSTDLQEVYGFEPVPEEALGHAGEIVGGECNMWTERAPQQLVMGKVFPRATGLAEVLWSGPDVTQTEGAYDRFLDRLDALGQRWAFLGMQPGLEGVPVEVNVAPGLQGTVQVTVNPALRNVGGTVRFVPADTQGEVAQAAVNVGQAFEVHGRGTVEVAVSVRGRSSGVTESFPVAGHAAAHQPLELSYAPSKHYTGGGMQALADGRRGSADFRDGAWQAVQGEDLVCVVDLGAPTAISALETQLYLYQDAWIFMPRAVKWSTSLDGERYEDLPPQAPWGDPFDVDGRQTVIPVRLEGLELEAQFVRMALPNAGPCPDWHDAATEPSWLFVDEFVVESEAN